MVYYFSVLFTLGTVVPSKTKIAYHFSTLVLINGQQHTLQIEPRDEYGNPTSNSTSLTDEANYSVHVHSVRGQPHFRYPVYCNFNCLYSRTGSYWYFPNFSLFLQLGTVDDDSLEGYYSKSVTLNKQQCQVMLRLTLRKTGCFRARISYKDQQLSNGEFDIIVLSGEQVLLVKQNTLLYNQKLHFLKT